jgi:photosystem II stability/assembly factor-like uncharacterized protein
MKNLFIILLIFFPRLISSQWITQYIDENVTLYDVRFINVKTGWICGGNLIYKTTNSGITWLRQLNPAQTGNLYQIHPVNENVVYVCGICTILKTTNGGENWTAIRVGSPPCGDSLPDVRALWFNDENKGWFSGNVQAMRTTNGGETVVDSQRIETVSNDIYFRDSLSGIILGNGKTYRSTDSGINWEIVPLPFYQITPFCWRLSFKGNWGWTASRVNIIYRTTNFGISWDSIAAAQTDRSFYPIEFANTNTGYIGGDPVSIFKTTDGGFNWAMQPIPQFSTSSGFLSIFALNDSVVWAVGAYGKILHTQNGGLVSVNSLEDNRTETFFLFQNYPNPFNPNTKIKFALKEDCFVRIMVYDVSGRSVANLINGFTANGLHEVDFNAQYLPSGIYFYTMEVNDEILFSKRMILKK